MADRPPRQWLLIGVACGLLAVVVLRSALAILTGSLKLVAVVGGLALLWVFLRGPRDGRP
jgi:hypothetical protein